MRFRIEPSRRHWPGHEERRKSEADAAQFDMAAHESRSDGSELPLPVDSAVGSASILDVLEQRAAARPEWPIYTFLSDDGAIAGARTTAQITARAWAGAARLQQSCQPGDRVLLLAPPGLDYIDAFLACLAAGVYAVPAYPPDPTRLVRTLPGSEPSWATRSPESS